MNREKQAIRDLMASTGHSYQQARALHLLQSRYELDTPAGTLPNPAVVLSWAQALTPVGAVRVQYVDAAAGPSLLLTDWGVEVWSAWLPIPNSRLNSVEEQAYVADRARQRDFDSLFSHSAFVRMKTLDRTVTSYREQRSEADWHAHLAAMVRYLTKRFTAEEVRAAEEICAHPRALEWIPTEGFATELRRATIAPEEILDPLTSHSWLPLVDALPAAHLLVSDTQAPAIIRPTAQHRMVITSGGTETGASLFEPFSSASRIHVRAFTTDRPGHSKCVKEWVIPNSEPAQIARQIERFAAAIA